MHKKVILWFRNDLRLHDNEALTDALNVADEIYPVYVFDPGIIHGTTKYGFEKTGKLRFKFICESVSDLRDNLRKKGSDLIIKVGKPEDILFKMAREISTTWIFCNRERTQEEVDVQDSLEQKLWTIGQEIRYSRGKMLYYTADLPFPVNHTPDSFKLFRKETDRLVKIRNPLPAPETMPPLESFDKISGPDDERRFEQLFANNKEVRQSSTTGGETQALELLNSIQASAPLVSNEGYCSETTNVSPYLSIGCLSPKLLYDRIIADNIDKRGHSFSSDLYRHLLWRDFHRLMAKKHGNAIFQKGGIVQKERSDLKDDLSLFNIWKDGRTGVPIVDAGINELNATGYVSRHVRRAVSSFLVDDMQVNWQMGAEYFESQLLDYDPCSNYGNWNYVAGLTLDQKEWRSMSILSRALKIDPTGNYVDNWVPAIKKLPLEYKHQPHKLDVGQQKELKFYLGKTYPKLCL